MVFDLSKLGGSPPTPKPRHIDAAYALLSDHRIGDIGWRKAMQKALAALHKTGTLTPASKAQIAPHEINYYTALDQLPGALAVYYGLRDKPDLQAVQRELIDELWENLATEIAFFRQRYPKAVGATTPEVKAFRDGLDALLADLLPRLQKTDPVPSATRPRADDLAALPQLHARVHSRLWRPSDGDPATHAPDHGPVTKHIPTLTLKTPEMVAEEAVRDVPDAKNSWYATLMAATAKTRGPSVESKRAGLQKALGAYSKVLLENNRNKKHPEKLKDTQKPFEALLGAYAVLRGEIRSSSAGKEMPPTTDEFVALREQFEAAVINALTVPNPHLNPADRPVAGAEGWVVFTSNVDRLDLIQTAQQAIRGMPSASGQSSWYEEFSHAFGSQPAGSPLYEARRELEKAINAVGECAVPVDGPANPTHVQNAFDAVIQKLEALRTMDATIAAAIPEKEMLTTMKALLPGTISTALRQSRAAGADRTGR